MRRYLPKEFRRRFNIAWAMLPTSVQIDLRPFIRDIRTAPSLLGVEIRNENSEVVTSEIDGSGWCLLDSTGSGVHIRFREDLENIDEVLCVYVILHELAHALEYLQDEPWRVDIRSTARSEFAADMQVAAWVARNAYRAYEGGYKQAKEIAQFAWHNAKEELLKWKMEETYISE